MSLDWGQFKLVHEALSERAILLHIAPHLATELPIIVPVYTWWEVPYMWAGLKFYDLVAALHWSGARTRARVQSSYLLRKAQALRQFPMLNPDKLKATMVYHDGKLLFSCAECKFLNSFFTSLSFFFSLFFWCP